MKTPGGSLANRRLVTGRPTPAPSMAPVFFFCVPLTVYVAFVASDCVEMGQLRKCPKRNQRIEQRTKNTILTSIDLSFTSGPGATAQFAFCEF